MVLAVVGFSISFRLAVPALDSSHVPPSPAWLSVAIPVFEVLGGVVLGLVLGFLVPPSPESDTLYPATCTVNRGVGTCTVNRGLGAWEARLIQFFRKMQRFADVPGTNLGGATDSHGFWGYSPVWDDRSDFPLGMQPRRLGGASCAVALNPNLFSHDPTPYTLTSQALTPNPRPCFVCRGPKP